MKKFIPLLLLFFVSCSNRIGLDVKTAGEKIALSVEDIQTILDISSGKISPLESLGAKYSGVDGLAIEVSSESDYSIGEELRKQFAGKGYLVFLAQNFFGQENKNNVLAMIRSNDTFDILRLQQTNYLEEGLSTEDLISILKKMETTYQFKFEITSAESAWLEANLSAIPTPIEPFVLELVALSPELLNDGTGRIEDILISIQEYSKLYMFFY